MNIFVFDIETVPDVDSGRRILQLSDSLSDKEVAKILFARAYKRSGTEFVSHHLHKIVAISGVLRSGESLKVWSLGERESCEKELIERFFDGISRFTPNLVSWNGSGFDLPVIHYRALLHGVVSPRYWDNGEEDRSFRFNNYLSRYHQRHIDLMDALSGYQPRAFSKLDEVATMLGFPGKIGMDGSQVWGAYCDGEIDEIRGYCETDVLNTYLIFLRFEFMRGHLSKTAYDWECGFVQETLQGKGKLHFDAFLEAWV